MIFNLLIMEHWYHVDSKLKFDFFFPDSWINGVDAIFPKLTSVILNLWYKAYSFRPERLKMLFFIVFKFYNLFVNIW